ncbi:MAG: (5-formylfuran-3-yl)methyl phosphate synthase [Hyphomicrobiaceae bacterium]|nr:(5-formylfuran-3-yl)methyl phosphate synthase [Hyphomicrobiaceae bacterium]
MAPLSPLRRRDGRPGMLASVRCGSEAEICLAAGADLIDAKDPATGALGALDDREIARIVGTVSGRRLVSATVGDLPCDPDVLVGAALRTAMCGVDLVKIGLWPGPGAASAIMALGGARLEGRFGRAELVAVMLADLSIDPTLLPLLGRAGFVAVMLDTAGKSGGGLLDALSRPEIATFVQAARDENLAVGLAGSLRTGHIAALIDLDADILGFRGALCEGQSRTGAIAPSAVLAVREAIWAAAGVRQSAE